ncbi:oxidoreductase [Nocardia alba]|uniref:NAD(P)-dependent dehydrogenase (Short-subunit alcohol dehydrogenase family) n=1 Tax=Nocardia alba TaxID=225051 RepID=A0A4R1FV42_9NOCA|nr:oxidoreductase [Nocardia alba]TCJ96388.1 NAD(P)-dependent dehydrogenase (short-subunit alcohol dehydrogenase family) [Nocardia alba]
MTGAREPRWSLDSAGDQSGRIAVVTGANTGIGLEIARDLAHRGATVVLACRNAERAAAARADILAGAADASVYVEELDTSSLTSVGLCAGRLRERWPVIDLLINNAGVMAKQHTVTEEGFELDFVTNFLGHFALTGHLADTLSAAPAARVVTVSSLTHRRRNATLDYDDLTLHRGFDSELAYARSKMASMTFMIELQRRFAASGSRAISLAAHPGGVRTGILREQNRLVQLVYSPRMTWLTGWFTQGTVEGAEPILRAALDPNVEGGEFFGPGGRGELIGPSVPVEISRRALDPAAGTRLWAVAEKLTGVSFPGA